MSLKIIKIGVKLNINTLNFVWKVLFSLCDAQMMMVYFDDEANYLRTHMIYSYNNIRQMVLSIEYFQMNNIASNTF